MSIRGERLIERIEAFARIGATARGGVHRAALSDEDRAARALLIRLAAERGFAVAQDAMANLFVRREGLDPSLPPLLIGSHLDSQPTGGRYDGVLGVLAAFEALEALEDAGDPTQRAVDVVAWTNEEGSRFSPGTMGSMAFAGLADWPGWLAARDASGATLADELARTLDAEPGLDRRPLGFPIAAYVELHIEQGPVLEREGVPVGIVTAIQGVRWLNVTLRGQAAHAGTTPLAFRRDPMAAAAGAIARLQAGVMPADADARLTVGRLAAMPGSINAIAESVAFTIDLRHPVADRLQALVAEVGDVLKAEAAANRCTLAIEALMAAPPQPFAPALLDALEAVARAEGIETRRLVSGAFHDALHIAPLAPTAMLFVPSRDGLSHNEREFTEPADILAGARLLHACVRVIAGTPDVLTR